MRALKLVLSLLVLVMTIGCSQAVVIQPGVELNPTGSLFYLYWNFTYEDNKPLIVEHTYVQVGGIRVYCEPQMLLKIVVNGWYPDNKNKDGKTVFDLEFCPDRAGWFIIKFTGLTPSQEYTVYKDGEPVKALTANSKGEIVFKDYIKDRTIYVVKCGAVEGVPVVPPVPTEEEVAWWNYLWIGIIVVAVGLLVLVIYLKRRY